MCTKIKKDKKKQGTLDSTNALYQGWRLIFNVFRSGIFQMKERQGKGFKILTH